MVIYINRYCKNEIEIDHYQKDDRMRLRRMKDIIIYRLRLGKKR